jgi:hypothetical protein
MDFEKICDGSSTACFLSRRNDYPNTISQHGTATQSHSIQRDRAAKSEVSQDRRVKLTPGEEAQLRPLLEKIYEAEVGKFEADESPPAIKPESKSAA